MSTRINPSFEKSNQQSTIGINITTASESTREKYILYIFYSHIQ